MNILKRIYRLLLPEEKAKGKKVVVTVFLTALLDFVGLAALLPVLYILLEGGENHEAAGWFCLLAVSIIVLKGLVVVAFTRYQNRYLLSLYKRFSFSLFSAYYHRGLLFIREQGSNRLGYEVNYLCFAFSQSMLAPMLRMAGDGLLILLVTMALAVYDGITVLLLYVCFIPFMVIYVWGIRKQVRKLGEEELHARRNQSKIAIDTFRGYTDLEVNGAFGLQRSSFLEGIDQVSRSRVKMDTLLRLPLLLSELSVVMGLTLLVAFGTGDVKVLVGIFAIAAFRLLPALRNILTGWTQIQNVAVCLDTLEEGLKWVPRSDEHEKRKITFEKQIEIKELSFAYPNSEPVLNDFNAQIKKGEYVGFRGYSGVGKSTLFNLMLGLLKPTSGEIRIDHYQLTPSVQQSWLRLVGYVPQEVFIFHGTLAENIALGCTDINRKRIARILQQVRLDKWTQNLPMGIDTELNEAGGNLSGGQKQRIGLARALYRNVDVLLLDEATSALDNDTEREINETLYQLKQTYSQLTSCLLLIEKARWPIATESLLWIMIMNRIYNIAGHTFTVSGQQLCTTLNQIEGFKPFELNKESSTTFSFVEETQVPHFKELQYTFEYEDVTGTFGCTPEGYLLRLKPFAEPELDLWCVKGEHRVYLSGNWSVRLVRFALWVGYGLMTLPTDTLAIHSSCIVYHDKAVLFLGESGTGKSTHTRLWREYIPGAKLLNDDSPILRVEDGRIWVYGSAWSGKTPCYKIERYELQGCVRLSQAPENTIQRLSLLQSYGAIHPSCAPEFAYDTYLYDMVSRVIGFIISVVPCYHLACLPDAEAASLSCRTLFG